eukprot:1159325-Pelagomonas_calceolata.AAC.7
MSTHSTIAERIAKFRSAPPAPRHARETSAEPKQFWWQTEAGGSRKHLRGAGEDVGGELGRDQDASATKRRSIAGLSDRGEVVCLGLRALCDWGLCGRGHKLRCMRGKAQERRRPK